MVRFDSMLQGNFNSIDILLGNNDLARRRGYTTAALDILVITNVTSRLLSAASLRRVGLRVGRPARTYAPLPWREVRAD